MGKLNIYKCVKTIYYECNLKCFTKGETYELQNVITYGECQLFICENDDMGDKHELWDSELIGHFVKTLCPTTKLKKHKLI